MVTKNLWVAGSVAAALAVSSGAAFADMSDSSKPVVPVAAYALLTNQTYNGIDLRQARAEGFSDSETATIAKIAHMSGMSFGSIKDRVISGASFGVLADQYNLRLKDVWDNQDYKDQIEMYKLAWNSTGKQALREKVMASQETYTAPMPAPVTTTAPTTVPNNTAPTPDTTTAPAP